MEYYITKNYLAMEEYINQLRKTAKAEIPYFTLMGTLILIDICAALNSENGETNKTKFKNWFDLYLEGYSSGNFNPCNFDSDECYKLRCRILHQGRAEIDLENINRKGKSGKITFRLGPGSVHKCNSNGIYYLDIKTFMNDVILAVTKWEQQTKDNQIVINNKSKLMKIVDQDPGMLVGNGTYIY